MKTGSLVANVIGEAYTEWKNKEQIFICAPTGSGKTTFVLKTLLPYFAERGKKILYLVNRRILKAQIREMISDLSHKYWVAIKVELYQEIEKKIKEGIGSSTNMPASFGFDYSGLEKISDFDCVICDECHYFLADSNYNTSTIFSFRWIQDVFQERLCIFMSATICEVKAYVEDKNLWEGIETYTRVYEIPKYDMSTTGGQSHKIRKAEGKEEDEKVPRHEIKNYFVDKDYRYIEDENIRIVRNRKELVDIVIQGNYKWLVFVDDIRYGMELERLIKRKFRQLAKEQESSDGVDNKVVMLSSGYMRDQRTTEEVDRIIRTSVPSAKVLITTSVLDNGVNIKDIDVRNLIIFADNETEFIQMLGRKRKDAQQLKLYIYEYDKDHFSKRKRQVRRKKELADKYREYIEDKVDGLEKSPFQGWGDDDNILRLYECEESGMKDQHRMLLQEMFDGYIKYEDLRGVFTVYKGKLLLNPLSFQNIQNLTAYYQKMIDNFEGEKNAFAREALGWLGKTGKVAEKIIRESRQTEEKQSRIRIIAVLGGIAGKKKLRDEFIEISDDLHEDLKVIVKEPVDFPDETLRTNEQFDRWSKINREFSKTGKVISKQSMEFLREFCRIPYQVTTDRHGGYIVQRVNLKGKNAH